MSNISDIRNLHLRCQLSENSSTNHLESASVFETLVISVSLAMLVMAICSVCEAVLFASSANQIDVLRKNGHSCTEHMQTLKTEIDEPVTAIIILRTIASTFGTAFAGVAFIKCYGEENLLLFAIGFTLSIIVLSEVFPKAIGSTYALRLVPGVTQLLKLSIFLLKPIIWLCRVLSGLLPKRIEESSSTEQTQTKAALSRESGELEEHEEKIINNIINLKSKMVRQVMTPRTVTFSLNENMMVEHAITKLTELSVHSRIPVYNRNPNNITGFVMRKDILQAAAVGKNTLNLAKFKRVAHFVPETARLNRILVDYFDRRQHLFIVVDEYGTMTGIISLEDVLEEIVGREIVDESDKAKDMRELARTRNIESRKNLKQNR
jgi:CBS domain containing-hemolysin-like protein